MAICLSHGGPTTYISPSGSNEVLVGTVDGVFSVHRENERKWQAVRKGLDGVHVHALLIEPQSGFVLGGAQKGSIFVSWDKCDSWERSDTGLTEKDVYSLNAVDVNGRVNLYAGTEPAHLFESTNLGQTWEEITSLRGVPSVGHWTFPAPPHMPHVKDIAFAFDPRTIYVCIEQGGLLKSDNGGLNWDELHGFDDDISFDLPEGAFPDDIHRCVVDPERPAWLYLSGGAGICRSRDGGSTWEHLTTPEMRIGYPDALLVHPRKEGVMFTAGARQNPRMWRTTHDADSAIARSRNSGESWEILSNGLPGHIRGNVEAMTMELSDDACSLFAGTTDGDVFYSEDEGERWRKIAEGLPAISKGEHYLRLRS